MKLYWFIVAYCLLNIGCDFNDKKADGPDNLLQRPPYAGLTDSIRQFPTDPFVYAQRALRLSQNNRHELATADYKKAWELKPEELMAHQYVNNLMLVNKPREAIDLLKECIAQWPEGTDLRRRLAEIYEQVGQQSRALAQYDEILQSDSSNFEVWYDKGLLLSKLGDTAAAIAALERSYFIQPIYTNGITLAGYYAMKRNPKTPALCNELIAKDLTASLPDAHFIKGLYYSYGSKYDSANAQFNECIRRDWRFADAHVEKAVILFEKKQYPEALTTLQTALSVGPSNADAYYWTGKCYEATGNKELALDNYQRTLSLDQGYEEAREGARRVK